MRTHGHREGSITHWVGSVGGREARGGIAEGGKVAEAEDWEKCLM